MGWVETLHDKLVAVDTAPFIYFNERHPEFYLSGG